MTAPMKDHSFHDILEQIIESESVGSSSDFTSKNKDLYNNTQEASFNSSNSTSETLHSTESFSTDISSILNELSVENFNGAKLAAREQGRKFYQVRRNASINSFATPITKPAHTMNEIQKKAYESILYAMNLPILIASRLLPLSFTAADLKKSFKKAALNCHPDTGGHHESFLSLKKDYEILKQLVMTSSHELKPQ